MNYLFYDCETGGKDYSVNSLLTSYFAVYDENLKLVDDLYLQLKPKNINDLNVEAEALAVNKINLRDHLEDPATITYEEGKVRLLDLLERNKLPNKRKHHRPCGHNISFDNDFIFSQLISKDEWEKTVHYNPIDTLRITTFLQDVGILPPELGRLTSLAEYFKIPFEEAHNARNDIKMNVEIYKAIRGIMKAHKLNSISGSESLLKIIEE